MIGRSIFLALALQASAEPWHPAGVSSPRFESHPALDPRTGDLYFVRSSPQFQGWKILVSRCEAGAWAAPVPAAFSGEGVEADPYFTSDGSRIWFISSRRDPPAKVNDDLDIWYSERASDGRWGAPVRLPAPINSPAAEWFPRPDGQGGLYFGSGRPGGFGETDIYHAVRDGEGWRVANMGGEVSTAANDYEFEPSPDGRFAVLMSDGLLYRLERDGEGWGPRRQIETGAAGFHVGPTLSPSGRTLLFARGGDPALSGELFRISAGAPEAWPACLRLGAAQ
jgi:WD40-like Beta Propeller Repeat